jgi:hypothetical protein
VESGARPVTATARSAEHDSMTTSHHIQTSAGFDELTPKRPSLLHELAVAALMIALVLGLAYGASWLLPLEFLVPRPR